MFQNRSGERLCGGFRVIPLYFNVYLIDNYTFIHSLHPRLCKEYNSMKFIGVKWLSFNLWQYQMRWLFSKIWCSYAVPNASMVLEYNTNSVGHSPTEKEYQLLTNRISNQAPAYSPNDMIPFLKHMANVIVKLLVRV